jgi:hypothetical protein
MDREGMADDEITIDDEQDSEGGGEVAGFIEELRQNQSLKELALHGSSFSDQTLPDLILALVGHPKLEKLELYRSKGVRSDHASSLFTTQFG